jgi:hypothetical protein
MKLPLHRGHVATPKAAERLQPFVLQALPRSGKEARRQKQLPSPFAPVIEAGPQLCPKQSVPGAAFGSPKDKHELIGVFRQRA